MGCGSYREHYVAGRTFGDCVVNSCGIFCENSYFLSSQVAEEVQFRLNIVGFYLPTIYVNCLFKLN